MKRLVLLLFLILPGIITFSQKVEEQPDDFQWTNKIFELNFESALTCKPVVWKEKIIIADSSGLITCVDTSGVEIWNHNIYGTVMNSPAVADGFIAIPTAEGELITLNSSNGEQIQSLIFDEAISTDIIVFNYTGSKQFMVPKQSESKAAVIFATGTGKISCYDLETLEMIWEDNTSKNIIANKLICQNNKIIYAAADGYLYCVDANAGWLIWKWKDHNSESKSRIKEIIAGEKEIFLLTPEGNLYSIDSRLGNLNWQNSTNKLKSPMGILKQSQTVFARGKKDKCYFISNSNGKIKKSIELKLKDDSYTIPPVEINGKILLPMNSGKIYSIDDKDKITTLLSFNEKITSLKYIEKNKFLISTHEGKIILFSI